MNHSFQSIILTWLALLAGTFCQLVHADSLFDTEELFEVTIQGPLPALNEIRDNDLVFEGATITYQQGSKQISVPVGLQARGKSRLDPRMCSFPQLLLLFEDKHTSGTLFESVRGLALAAQCRPGQKEYEDYILSEFLAYQLLNILTPNSYKSRLAELRYLDNDGKLMNESFGFFLEPHDQLANRIQRDRLKVAKTTVNDLDRSHLNLISVYQFMISHLDWAATQTSSGECCHNGQLFGDLSAKDVLYVPYDFDQSGLVNAKYALVSPLFRVDGVRDRRYGGYCSNTALLPDTLALFQDRKAEMLELINSFPYMTEEARADRSAFLATFFDVIDSPEMVEKKLHFVCYDRDDI